MKRSFAVAAALIAATVFTMPAAQAGGRGHHRHVAKEVIVAGVVTGAATAATVFSINAWNWKWDSASTGVTSLAVYGASSLGCAAVAPMVATVLVKRPLTMREGHVLAGSCFLPILGGYLVNAAYNANPQWEAGEAPVKKHHRRKMAAK